MDRLSMYLELYRPGVHVLTSKSLEVDSSCEIYLSAMRLSEEVKDYIKDTLADGIDIQAIHFVGYSIGGLVARAALEYLEQFKDRFRSYTSISCPHLGIAEPSDSIVSKGRRH